MSKMIKTLLIWALFVCLSCGCSSAGMVTVPEEDSLDLPAYRLPQTSRWNWNTALYRVSADHTSIEKVPNRSSEWHFNVNSFVEPPNCSQCLMVGNPQVQLDGTIKIKVTLSHPFPLQPVYTGFDVRGTIMFPATKYWRREPGGLLDGELNYIFEEFVPFYFSSAEDGGAELLNADGFTMYLFPGLDLIPHIPITQYSKGKQAYGPDPDSTINGYKLFTKDPERRMFRVTDSITRTYHIDPPDGEFTFGYVIDASWAQPTTTPVTDPKNDFPYWANCEDGYILEATQIAPFYTGTYKPGDPSESEFDRKVLRAVVLGNELSTGLQVHASIFCPDLILEEQLKTGYIAGGQSNEYLGPGLRGVTLKIGNVGLPPFYERTYQGAPGEYTALLVIQLVSTDLEDPNPKQISGPIVFYIIKLHVEEGGFW